MRTTVRHRKARSSHSRPFTTKHDLDVRRESRQWLEHKRTRWWQEDNLALRRLGLGTLVASLAVTGYGYVMQPVFARIAEANLPHLHARVYGFEGSVLAGVVLFVSICTLHGVRAAADAQASLEEQYQFSRGDYAGVDETLGVTAVTTRGGRDWTENMAQGGKAIGVLMLAAAAIFVVYGF